MINTFKRYEKKYILTTAQKIALEERIQEYMELDPYCKLHKNYLIRNIYYDTDNNDLVHMSISKPVFKEKLRVRKYGAYNDGRDEYFMEIKRKYDSIVYKRRVTLSKKELDEFIETGIGPKREKFFDQQVIHELEYLLKTYKVHPACFISYVRVAYFSKTDPTFRLTFDDEVHSRRRNLDFDIAEYDHNLVDDGYYLMEVKAGVSFPLWFANALSDLKIYPNSFSKYGHDYQLLTEEK